jgi:hypothetical protein
MIRQLQPYHANLKKRQRIALDDLNLRHVFVIYPGIQRFPLASRVEAIPLQTLAKGVSLLNDL